MTERLSSPRAGVDYPATWQSFESWFPDDDACRRYLTRLRWPDGFVCPMCGNPEGWPTARGLWMCRSCNRQTSITAGTIFHRSRLPLKTWFSAIWFVCAQKTGVSALGLQQVLGFGSYETAWAWLHKLRRAMVRPDRELLGGPGVTVELDSTFIGGRQGGRVRNQYLNKQEVAIAVEHRQPSGFGRARLALIDSQDRKKGLFTFAHAASRPARSCTPMATDSSKTCHNTAHHPPANRPARRRNHRARGTARRAPRCLAAQALAAGTLHERSLILAPDLLPRRVHLPIQPPLQP